MSKYRPPSVLFLVSILLLGFGPLSSKAQSIEDELARGERLAQSLCIACHGPQGVSVSPIWPSIAGQKRSYLVKTMKEYRSGIRQDPLMTPQSQTLSDAQIEATASYYSSFKIQIAAPAEPQNQVPSDGN